MRQMEAKTPGFRRAFAPYTEEGIGLSEKKQDWSIVIRPRTKWYDINFREFWQYRDLIGLFVKRDFVVKYKQTVLGPAWAVIQPLLTTIIFTFIFGTVAQLDTDGVPEFLFYMCGNIVWHYFSSCLVGNSNTFVENVKVFTKIYFPRLLVPASTVITNLVTYLIQFVLFLGFLIYYMLFKGFTPQFDWGYVLLTIPAILQVAMLGMGCGMVLSSMTTKYRDLHMLVGFGVQLWMYATPVAYSSSILMDKYYWVYMLNPMTPLIELFRAAFLGTGNFRWESWAISCVFTVLVLFWGIVRFSKIERTFVDTI